MRKIYKEIAAIAESEGMVDVKIVELGGRHPRLLGMLNGREICHVVPGTPGGGRGMANLRAQLRRLARV